MREIKFRGKRIDNGEWVNGSGLLVSDDFCVIDTDTEMYVDEKYEWAGNTHFFRIAGAMCDLKTIGQYTGLKDKNGKEIYEGDVVEWVFFYERLGANMGVVECDTIVKGVIHWRQGGFILEVIENDFENAGYYSISALCTDTESDIEIISNIHDNQELIKEEEK